MRFAALILLAAMLGVACSALVACGGSNSDKLIPSRDAQALKRYADRVGTAVGQQDCAEAQTDVARAINRIGALPATVDPICARTSRRASTTSRARPRRKCQGTTTEATPTTDTGTTDTGTTDTGTTDTGTTDTGTTGTGTTGTGTTTGTPTRGRRPGTTGTGTTNTNPAGGGGTGGTGGGDQGGTGGGQGGTPPPSGGSG